jgi:hypothetical protein
MNFQHGQRSRTSQPTFVQFLGWPRSGTTLLMSLLNAYPGVWISHEADVSSLVADGCSREQILTRMRAADEHFSQEGKHWFGYDYRVESFTAASPFDPAVILDDRRRVLGDKKAGGTTEIFALHPDIFHRTESVLGASLRVLIVVRNPFDVITSISRNLPGDVPTWFRVGADPLTSAIDWYALLATVVQRAIDAQPCPMHPMSFSHLISDPADTLTTTLRFIGLLPEATELDPHYAAIVRSKVFTAARTPSLDIEWTPTQRRRVHDIIESTPFLHSVLGETS